MPCSAIFSLTLQTEILSTETSNFLKQIIFPKSFNSVLQMYPENRLMMNSHCSYNFRTVQYHKLNFLSVQDMLKRMSVCEFEQCLQIRISDSVIMLSQVKAQQYIQLHTNGKQIKHSLHVTPYLGQLFKTNGVVSSGFVKILKVSTCI